MKKSLAASVSVHLAVLFAALFVLPSSEEMKAPPVKSIQVDISNIQDATKTKAVTNVPVPVPKIEPPAPPKTEIVKDTKPAPKIAEEEILAAKPKEPEPEPEPEVKPEEKPLDPDPLNQLLAEQEKKLAEEKKIEEQAEKKEAEARKKAEEKKKKEAEIKKKELERKKDLKKALAEAELLLDTSNDERTAPQKPTDDAGAPEQGAKAAQGEDDALAATLTDALRQKLSECWSVPAGAREANISVKVKFALNIDGTVNGQPVIVGGGGDQLFATTAQSAISAVMECQAYDFLPRDRYDMWQQNTVNFTPDMMSGT